MKEIKLYLAILIVLHLAGLTELKSQIQNQSNFKLYELGLNGDDPNDVPVDILTVNGKVFIYLSKSIKIYEIENGQYIFKKSIPFLNEADEELNLGYFNPMFMTPEGRGVSMELMCYNENAGVIYFTNPDLRIKKMNVNGYQTDTVFTTNDLADWKILTGYSVLKFDKVNNRLYWLVQGRNPGNPPGGFHGQDTYVGFFTADSVTGNLTPQANEYVNGHQETGDYANTAYDVEFSRQSNYFFISRKFKIHVYEWGSFPTPLYQNPLYSIGTTAGKIGKLEYIDIPENIGADKIVALPFRGIYDNWEPEMDVTVQFYIIDANNPTSFQAINAPSKRVTDAVYLEGSNDLVLCYTPDNDFVQDETGVPVNSYAAIYPNPVNVTQDPSTLTTDAGPLTSFYTSEYDKNRPFSLTKTSGNSFLISKTHEITHVEKVGQQYEETQWLRADGNIFSKGVLANARVFALNTAGCGMEVFDVNGANHKSYKTGYPAYEICANPLNRKLIIYSKLNTAKTGFFIYDMNDESIININNDINPDGTYNTTNDFTGIVGDIVYNPYLNQYLVSENIPFENGQNARIFIYDAADNSKAGEISVSSDNQPGEYLKEMFVAPNRKLYVMANTKFVNNQQPLLYIYNFDGNGYYTSEDQVEQLEPIADISQAKNVFFFNAHFCYVPQVKSTFLSVASNGTPYFPYYTMFNTSERRQVIEEEDAGLVVKIDQAGSVITRSIDQAGEIICPDAINENTSSRYTGKIIVNGKKINILNYGTGFDDVMVNNDEQHFLDITYNSFFDKIYGYYHEPYSEEGSSFDINIHEIDESGNTTTDPLYSFPGQAAGIFSTPLSSRYLYLYNKIDNLKLGDEPQKLVKINLEDNTVTSTSLQNVTTYPDYQTYQGFYHNIIQPYFDPVDYKMYLPNGGHSNVSHQSFVLEEALHLRPGITWLSFPRLPRGGEKPSPDDVLLNTIWPGYNYGSELITSREDIHINSFFNGLGWSDNKINQIVSDTGYILNFTDDIARRILLRGEIPAQGSQQAMINLDHRYENWVGYYLPQTQNVFDIIPQEVLDDFKQIKHQDWSVYNTHLPNPPPPDGDCPAGWKCGENVNLQVKYADMLIITTYNNDHEFQWLPYTDEAEVQTAEATYYTYSEQVDYEPIFIELDTAANPLEIGAFVNDSCIGAAAIGQDDSLVQLRAYTDSSNMGNIVFEEYYGLKSSPSKIRDYLVEDPQTGAFNKRKIHMAENQDYYMVSFRKDKQNLNSKPGGQNPELQCRPNPVADICHIQYTLFNKGFISMKIYDLYGRMQHVIYEGDADAGKYHLQWIPKNARGKQLSKGVYIIRLEAASGQAQEKVLVL